MALLAAIGIAWALGLPDYLSCGALRDNRAWLLSGVHENYLLATALFFLVYVATVALSLPGAAVLTIAGGFLFGILTATLLVVLAGTLGAVVIFTAARTAFAEPLRARVGPWLEKLRREFAAEGFSYLLFLRLVPLFPFFVVNLVPAFLGISLRHYALATLIGIIPGTFVFVSVGAGLGSIFDAGGTCSLENILTPQVLIALIGLALLALLPVAYRKWRQRHGSQGK
ncbi:MAG TPA: TVP38/TMEM64 family protein [Dongiaceae bacterium]